MSGDRDDLPAARYEFGPYSVDSRLRRLYKDGEPLDLTPKAADTLVTLLEHAGRVVEKDELLRAVWGDVFVGEDTLAQNISTLRRVLADDANRPVYIATVPRRGYKFVAPVRTAALQTADTPAAAPTLPPRSPATGTRSARDWWIGLGAAAVLGAVLGSLADQRVWVRAPPPTAVEFTIVAPESRRFSPTGGMLVMSPDGASVAFLAVDPDGVTSMWLRTLGSTVARPLAGTDSALAPFWSPDSRTIGFFSERRLKAVDVASGAVRVIAPLASSRALGGTWSDQGEILFSVPNDGMYLVSASGGSPRRLEDSQDAGCSVCGTWPHFLPDGRRFLYTVVRSDTATPGIYVGEIGKPGGQLLLDAVSSSTYVAPGYLAYARFGTLFVQRFDPTRAQLTGTPVPVAENVAHNARTGRVMASVSQSGALAFRRPLVTELVWVDRAGTVQGLAAPAAIYVGFSIAPDGQRVAAARLDPRTGTTDIWVFGQDREVRVTDDPGWDDDPVWSDDGRHVVYGSRRDGRWRIYQRQATAVGPEELVIDAGTPVTPLQMLASAQMVYSALPPDAPFDVWRFDRGRTMPLAYLGGFNPSDARLSPDERWVAYGRPEVSGGVASQTVYVSPHPFGETRRALSDAASSPRWRADGRELFYLSKDSTIVSIPIDPRGTPTDLQSEVLFRASGLAPTGVSGPAYDVAGDGQRFVLKREAGPSPIHVVLNWTSRLDQ